MIFVAAALVLTTVGVFAGKAKFTTGLYAQISATSFIEIAPTYTSELTSVNTGQQAQITDYQGNKFPLFGSNSTATPLYSVTTW